jgi:dolichol-phosphate mannosyltransferase
MISIVVPCYNETNGLSQLYKRISQAADTWGEAWEVVAVNDGSEDNTLSILKRFHAKDHRWKVVSFSRNFGHQMAVAAGLKFASGDCAVITS